MIVELTSNLLPATLLDNEQVDYEQVPHFKKSA
jgi:hypothetical protein